MNIFAPVTNNQQPSFYNVIKNLGLTSGLQAVWDPGDITSYTGSGTSLKDPVGQHEMTVNGSPTFVKATSGRKDAYFEHNGSSDTRLTNANPSWADQLHWSGSVWTICKWIWVPASWSSGAEIFATQAGGGTAAGVRLAWNASTVNSRITINVASGSVVNTSTNFTSSEATPSSWNFIGLAWTVTNPTPFNIHANARVTDGGTSTPANATFATSGASSQKLTLGNDGTPSPATVRQGPFAIWTGVMLTSTQMGQIKAATAARFGL